MNEIGQHTTVGVSTEPSVSESEGLSAVSNGRRFGVVWIFGLLVTIVVVLSVLIIIFVVNKKEPVDYVGDVDNWGNLVGECLFSENTDVDCEEFAEQLETLIDVTGDEDERTLAYTDLAALYSGRDMEEPIELLEGALVAELSDVNKYTLLNELSRYYRDLGDKEAYVGVLKRLVELPDDMKLEREDWAKAKELILAELESLEDKDVE